MRFIRPAVVLGLAVLALVLLTVDLRAEGYTCGTALIARDPNPNLFVSGDPREDIVTEQLARSACAQAVRRQRFLVALPLIASVLGAWWLTRMTAEEANAVERIARVRRVTP